MIDTSRRRLPYVVIDVFTDRPLEGNSLAIFTDARGLSTEQMQALAREMNLAESTFILPRARRDCCSSARADFLYRTSIHDCASDLTGGNSQSRSVEQICPLSRTQRRQIFLFRHY